MTFFVIKNIPSSAQKKKKSLTSSLSLKYVKHERVGAGGTPWIAAGACDTLPLCL